MSNQCDNCQHGQLSWIAVDGKDIRESQYPPMIECPFFKELKEPQDICDEYKGINDEY